MIIRGEHGTLIINCRMYLFHCDSLQWPPASRPYLNLSCGGFER